MFADVVEAARATALGGAGFEDGVPFDGLCDAAGRGCEDGGEPRLMTLSEARGRSESALRFGGAAAGAGCTCAVATDFGFSPVI